MKNLIASVSLAAALLAPSFAFAAMPNFIGTGYKVAANCTAGVDRPIFELVGSNFEQTGCNTPEGIAAADALAKAAQEGIRFAVGSSVTLKTGKAEVCPFWYPQFAGCVISSALVQ